MSCRDLNVSDLFAYDTIRYDRRV